ncbi:MAG: hypothetical protein EPGJADBJ_02280 [Saprospiraceae bacterium]|nr:hypothetical protein [Saprospiraceae bacterium]
MLIFIFLEKEKTRRVVRYRTEGCAGADGGGLLGVANTLYDTACGVQFRALVVVGSDDFNQIEFLPLPNARSTRTCTVLTY